MPFTPKALELADFMEMISEECYCAGWVGDLEFTLWGIVQRGEPGEFGRGEITPNDITTLKRLSTEAGGWIQWHETNFRGFVSMEEWLTMYSEYQNRPTS